ncbi:hypothetical protein ES703_18835 [subsurface metagenome]
MGRHGHNRTGAVAYQDVVAYPNWNLFVVDGIYCVSAYGFTGFLFGQIGSIQIAFSCGLFTVFSNCFFSFITHYLIYKWMLWCHHHIGCAEQGIRPSSKDANRLVETVDLEIDIGPNAFAYPIGLQFFY